jgi:hypothetical protein
VFLLTFCFHHFYSCACANKFEGWQRDLTQEGVEPNPGASWDEFQEKLKEKLGEFFEFFKTPIDNLKNAVFNEYKDLPDTINVKKYLEQRKGVVVKLGITEALLRSINEVLNGMFLSFESLISTDFDRLQPVPQGKTSSMRTRFLRSRP